MSELSKLYYKNNDTKGQLYSLTGLISIYENIDQNDSSIKISLGQVYAQRWLIYEKLNKPALAIHDRDIALRELSQLHQIKFDEAKLRKYVTSLLSNIAID
jgi:hypothetical protein